MTEREYHNIGMGLCSGCLVDHLTDECEMPRCMYCGESMWLHETEPNAIERLLAPAEELVNAVAHRVCVFRGVSGSVAHIEERCGCYVPGATDSDDPDISKLEAAEAALAAFRRKEFASRVKPERGYFAKQLREGRLRIEPADESATKALEPYIRRIMAIVERVCGIGGAWISDESCLSDFPDPEELYPAIEAELGIPIDKNGHEYIVDIARRLRTHEMRGQA